MPQKSNEISEARISSKDCLRSNKTENSCGGGERKEKEKEKREVIALDQLYAMIK